MDWRKRKCQKLSRPYCLNPHNEGMLYASSGVRIEACGTFLGLLRVRRAGTCTSLFLLTCRGRCRCHRWEGKLSRCCPTVHVRHWRGERRDRFREKWIKFMRRAVMMEKLNILWVLITLPGFRWRIGYPSNQPLLILRIREVMLYNRIHHCLACIFDHDV